MTNRGAKAKRSNDSKSGLNHSRARGRLNPSSQKSAKRRSHTLTGHQVCFEFQSKGSCKFGEKCCFSHNKVVYEKSSDVPLAVTLPVCYEYRETGLCPYGHKCKYLHNGSQVKNNVSQVLEPQASDDVIHFLGRVKKALLARHFKLDLSHPKDRALWMQSWAAVGVGAQVQEARTLSRVIMRLPATACLVPSPIHVLSTLVTLVRSCSKDQPSQHVIETLELVADVVENRLPSKIIDNPSHLWLDGYNRIEELRAVFHDTTLRVISDPSFATRGATLLTRFLPLLDSLKRSGRNENASSATRDKIPLAKMDARAWNGWRAPQLAWLLQGAWLDAPSLLVNYETIDSYIETLRRIVTMLTFFWGAGAVFPKCRSRGHDGQICQQPLCTIISNKSRKQCGRRLPRGKSCVTQAHWGCSRSGHDVACRSCLSNQQRLLVGSPGQLASTDIYDCVVERDTVRREGVVHILSQISSRKPPSIAPNWRTTYRLKCSALVAVARLGASMEPLSSHYVLEWAEVVPVSQQKGFQEDFHDRSMGRMAIRLLNRADLSMLEQIPEGLERGARIAVIDLQVFVPEVITVLSTISDASFSGHLKQLLFSDVLMGNPKVRTVSVSDTNVQATIENAVTVSEIDLLVRLPEAMRANLIHSLVRLVQSANLYGTQLQAFAAALSNGLHCTQGPPGTGKSYIGVVLIRALDIIRTVAARSGITVGPIVVLSYKTHALDEVVLDVLRQEGAQSSLVRGMIRCGKPDDERLNQYCERRNPAEIKAQETLSSRVACLRAAKKLLRIWGKVREEFSGIKCDDPDLLGMPENMEFNDSINVGEGSHNVIYSLLQALLFYDRLQRSKVDGDLDDAKGYGLIRSLVEDDIAAPAFEQEMIESLKSLSREMEHWPTVGKSRAVFLLQNWLSGAVPPPRCAAACHLGRCVFQSMGPGEFFQELRKCKYELGCGNQRVEGVSFCEQHNCEFHSAGERCPLVKFSNSNVCADHACILCKQADCNPVLAKGRGTEACTEHTCRIEICDAACLAVSLPLCNTHCCRVCSHFSLSKKNPRLVKSLERVRHSEFCKEHKCEAPDCNDFRILEGDIQLYRDLHACQACVGQRNVAHRTVGKSRFCSAHFCARKSDIGCLHRREKGSDFCMIHTCRFCILQNRTLDQAVVDAAPRNVCKTHALCIHILPDRSMCDKLARGSTREFCGNHLRRKDATAQNILGMVSQQCNGLTTKGKRCKVKSKETKVNENAFYCDAHLEQRSETSEESSSEAGLSDTESGTSSYTDDQPVFKASSTSSKLNNIPNGNIPFTDSQGGDSTSTLNITSGVHDSERPVSYVEVQCSGLTKKKKRPCRTRTVTRSDSVFYCNAHIDQKPQTYVAPVSTQDVEMATLGNTRERDSPKLEQVREGLSSDRNSASSQQSEWNNSSTESSLEDEIEKKASEDEAGDGISNGESITKDDEEASTRHIQNSSTNASQPHQSSDSQNNNESPLVFDDLERPVFGQNPDEYDFFSSDSMSSEEEPSHLQHLREVIGAGSFSGSESSAELGSIADGLPVLDTTCREPTEWSWGHPVEERCILVASFIGGLLNSFEELLVLAEGHVDVARQERKEAEGFVLKTSRLIGATVIGATRRLEAIRASEPFAMIVEEACEVLEPTLVSVLAVRSLRKLELIGDHRQLPAFVQPCWFSIQTTIPSIRRSLFERLVLSAESSNGRGKTAHCTVLDEQRRMRPQIAGLTKCEYEDVVDIIDHECTTSQRIGDRQLQTEMKKTWALAKCKPLRPGLASERSLWFRQGNAVPGIGTDVFFWNIESEEGRPSVGLSRCNTKEAEFCSSLVRWLLRCGIPPACITVITPYKGQKITITKHLRKVPGAYFEGNNQLNGGHKNEVRVSTVDRYQGDENDIVILSLVCTRPGNRFIALRNRFIVAASRARIGFYVLGSTNAFSPKPNSSGGGPSHWQRFLKELRSFNSCDVQSTEHLAGQSKKPNRIGERLDIQCPRHPDSWKAVESPSDFPVTSKQLSSFCSKPCPFILPWCRHPCRESCHSVSQRQHTAVCQEHVPRPCNAHTDTKLLCSNVRQKQNARAVSLSDALMDFHCEVEVQYCRPECSHSVSVTCYQYTEIQNGSCTLNECEEIVGDYVHPSCGHVRTKPSCHRRRYWENKPPVCSVTVSHVRDCGCEVRMTCHERVQESLMTEAPPCLEAVLQRCPRCSHLLSSRCQEATALRELWSEEVDEAITSNPPAISHGIVYGPSETELSQKYPYKFSKILPECFVETRYIASCGHESMTCCSRGFRFSDGTLDEPPCTEKITFQSPICGHQIEAHCHLRPTSSAVFTTVCKERFSPISGKIERFVDEQELRNAPSPNSEFKNLSKICQDSVTIVRDCGHQTSGFLCSRIFASLNHNRIPPCDALIDVRRPCGHVFEVRCHRQTEPLPVCMEPVDELFNYPCGKANHSTQPRTCHELALLRLDIDIQCPVNVECIRARCGHSVNVVCYLEESVTRTSPGSVLDFNVSPVVIQEETEYCESAAGVAECMAPVIYQRACGHQNVGVPCSTAFSWSASPAEAPPCQNEIVTKSPLCSHGIRVLCCRKPDVFSYDPWCRQPPDHVTVDVQDEDEVKTCPVVYAGERVPLHSPEMDVLLHCGQTTLLQRVCGHEAKIPCETIFDALKMACEEPQQVECQKCMKTRTYPCHKNSSMSMQCENLVEKKCSLCSENTVRIECYKDVVLCKREVSSLLRCGHSVKWMCGDEDPRLSEPADACLICTHKTWSDVRDNSLTLLHQKETLKNESRNENTAFLAAAAERRLRGEVNPENFNFIELVTGLRKRALDAVPESWISEFVEVNSISELRLLGAYVDILTQNIDNFARSMASEDLEGLRLCRPPRISDESSAYDIVYFVRGSKQHTADCFRYSFTRYGMGITAYLFSTESLLHFIKK